MRRLLILVTLTALAMPGAAVAQETIPRSALDVATAPALLGQPGRVAIGGDPVALGDVNGDGRADIGSAAGQAYAPATPGGAVDQRGLVQVVFGPLTDRVAFGAARGLLIRSPVENAEPRVAAAGDLDEDGLADVAVAVGGQAWIVWGRRDPAVLVLGADGASTRVELGPSTYAGSIAGAGDLDDDGHPDLAVGVIANAAGNRSPGAVGIVHGTGARLVAPAPGTVIGGLTPGSNLGSAVVGLGDTDGDGIDDVGMASRPYEIIRPVAGATPPTAWVVRGARSRVAVDLRSGDPRVTEIVGGEAPLRSSPVPYAVGDLDGDGRTEVGIDDLEYLTTAPRQPAGVITTDGRVALLRGTATPAARIDLSQLGDGGVTVLDVPDSGERLGGGGLAAADLDGDGRRTVWFGVVGRDATITYGAASTQVIVELRPDLPPGTYRSDDPQAIRREIVARAATNPYTPPVVAAVGDQDGDGRDDLLVGNRSYDGVSCRSVGGAVAVLAGGVPTAPDPGAPSDVQVPVVRTGTPVSDRLFGGPFADRLEGLGGDDCLVGGPGDDHLLGGGGDDDLEAGQGAARLDGGPGNDTLLDYGYESGTARDVLLGGEGDDDIDHQGGPVSIDAGPGDDDVTDGGSGTVLLGAGRDTYFGSYSDPSFKGSVSGAHRVDGGPGDDRVTGGRRPDVLRGGDGADVLTGLSGDDRLLGGTGGDTLDGVNGDDRLDGGGGDDRLAGGPGKDRLRGGSGADRLDGGTGRDELAGGSGVDRIHAADGERDVIRCDGDRDRLVVDRRDRLVGCSRARVTRRTR